jgi:hypothetical protein
MNKIKKLSRFLEAQGFSEEAHRVSNIAKMALALTTEELKNLRHFVSLPGETDKSPNLDPSKWEGVIEALDHPTVAFEQVDQVGETLKGIGSSITGAVGKIYNWATGGKEKVEELKEPEAKQAIKQLENLIKRAEYYGESELLKVADQSWWRKFVSGDISKSTKGGLPLWKAVPILGAFVSLYSLFKNFKEAITNGKIILQQLPLSNYGITIKMIFTLDAAGLSQAFDTAIESLKDTPDAPSGQPSLRELAEIMNVISRFWMDSYKTILNTLYSIIDVSEVLFGLFDGPFPFADAIAQTFGGILTTGIIVGAELGGEHFASSWWKKQKDKIRTIAEQHLSAPSDESVSEPAESELIKTETIPEQPTPVV